MSEMAQSLDWQLLLDVGWVIGQNCQPKCQQMAFSWAWASPSIMTALCDSVSKDNVPKERRRHCKMQGFLWTMKLCSWCIPPIKRKLQEQHRFKGVENMREGITGGVINWAVIFGGKWLSLYCWWTLGLLSVFAYNC